MSPLRADMMRPAIATAGRRYGKYGLPRRRWRLAMTRDKKYLQTAGRGLPALKTCKRAANGRPYGTIRKYLRTAVNGCPCRQTRWCQQ